MDRRKFVKAAAAAGAGLSVAGTMSSLYGNARPAQAGKRIGIIGLDTSHSIAFTKALNASDADPAFAGYRIVAAYPHGSKDIESSVSRIPGYTEEIQEFDVAITESIEELLEKVDAVMLETNDGRRHLEQAMPVFKAGKRMFIDKPIAASLEDTVAIFEASREYNVPVFSSSSLRYAAKAQEIAGGELIGKVVGADTYSPATLEKTHPDLFWYGIHGVEMLFTVMGAGCKSVSRVHTEDTDIVVGVWEDGRVGTFRGTRSGKSGYGGFAFGEEGNSEIGPYKGYEPLLKEVIAFFETGTPPVSPEETLEIITFMEAAEESKRKNGATITL